MYFVSPIFLVFLWNSRTFIIVVRFNLKVLAEEISIDFIDRNKKILNDCLTSLFNAIQFDWNAAYGICSALKNIVDPKYDGIKTSNSIWNTYVSINMNNVKSSEILIWNYKSRWVVHGWERIQIRYARNLGYLVGANA